MFRLKLRCSIPDRGSLHGIARGCASTGICSTAAIEQRWLARCVPHRRVVSSEHVRFLLFTGDGASAAKRSNCRRPRDRTDQRRTRDWRRKALLPITNSSLRSRESAPPTALAQHYSRSSSSLSSSSSPSSFRPTTALVVVDHKAAIAGRCVCVRFHVGYASPRAKDSQHVPAEQQQQQQHCNSLTAPSALATRDQGFARARGSYPDQSLRASRSDHERSRESRVNV